MVDIDREFFDQSFDQKAKICVIGVGGGGNNAVDRMIADSVEGIDFITVNTDSQVLKRSQAPTRIQLGEKLTGGLGAGGQPEVGAKAAEESKDDISKAVHGANMLFVTAGMGGGTGTGAAPVIARIAKSLGILTVGVVTKPFVFEGKVRMANAQKGIDELRKNVDTLLVIPNEKLMDIMDEKSTFKDALKKADQVLTESVEGISSLISRPGEINLDFADVSTIMRDKGVAHIGIGRASGKNRAQKAAEIAINSPLLETSIQGAHSVLVNVSGSNNLTMFEVGEASRYVTANVENEDANIIFGSSIIDDLDDEVIVTVVATAFDNVRREVPRTAYEPISSFQDRGVTPIGNMSSDTQQQPNESEAPPVPRLGEIGEEEQIRLPVFLQKNRKNNRD
ncbi:MAG: cell division protein FtsZ [Defluviitaleaceae bacterium]|nr:cell division protein FtsZ [Defluviitaleaceae bacterium]